MQENLQRVEAPSSNACQPTARRWLLHLARQPTATALLRFHVTSQ